MKNVVNMFVFCIIFIRYYDICIVELLLKYKSYSILFFLIGKVYIYYVLFYIWLYEEVFVFCIYVIYEDGEKIVCCIVSYEKLLKCDDEKLEDIKRREKEEFC